MISNKIDVIRDEVASIVDVENIVPGDIVKLSSGDMIPGDVRFLEAKDLFIDQAPLTGESNPVEKFAVLKENEDVTSILKDYMLKGYAVNQKRLEYLEKTIKLIDIANRMEERLTNQVYIKLSEMI